MTVKSKTEYNLELILTKYLLPVDPCPQNPTIEVTLMYVNLKALLHT